LGYLPNEELKILKKWIKNIHIKDRKYSGLTVPLGTGDTDFELVFSTLREIDYYNDLIIQGARIPGKTYLPKDTCLTYLRFVDEYLNKYYK
jgi:sugar phosphate isomerase/epimerase